MGAVAQAVRFRTELTPRYGSWLTVLLVYGLGAILLLSLLGFATAFRELDAQRSHARALERNVAVAERLVDELQRTTDPAESDAALARFRDHYQEDRIAPRDIPAPPHAGGGRHADSSDLIAARQSGATPERLKELAQQVTASVRAQAIASDRSATELDAKVNFRVAILGVMVITCVFGGGVVFLLRSQRLERLLAERAAELDEVDASRRLFFAKASHELRTPVTALLGEAEVAMVDAEDPECMRATLGHIAAQATFLGHRIEEMIALAKAGDGKLHLDRERIDMREVVSDAVQEARAFAASVEAVLGLTLPEGPVIVMGDALWLKRALLAVIENALKFSPMGGRVDVTLAPGETLAEVTVTDQGIGLVPEQLPLVFEAYYQTHAGKARGGSGLGLAMTRWVAEQHGGRAWARNIGEWRASGCAITVAVKRERERERAA